VPIVSPSGLLETVHNLELIPNHTLPWSGYEYSVAFGGL
jgi:hypothetical protein